MHKIFILDNQIVEFISSNHTVFWDYFFKVVTFLGDMKFVIPAFFIASIIVFYKKRDFLFPFFVSFSFPSGHATVAIGFYGFLGYVAFKYFKERKNTFLSNWSFIKTVIFIILLGFSRLYFGVHFPTDIIAGYMVGMIGFCLGIIVYNKKRFC